MKAPLFSSAHPRYVFFTGLFLAGRSPALPAPLEPVKFFNTSFRFLAQKYYIYLTCANFLAKKNAKYVVKHKKRGAKPPFFACSPYRPLNY